MTKHQNKTAPSRSESHTCTFYHQPFELQDSKDIVVLWFGIEFGFNWDSFDCEDPRYHTSWFKPTSGSLVWPCCIRESNPEATQTTCPTFINKHLSQNDPVPHSVMTLETTLAALDRRGSRNPGKTNLKWRWCGREIIRVMGQHHGLVVGHWWLEVQMDVCYVWTVAAVKVNGQWTSQPLLSRGLQYHLLGHLLPVGYSQLQPPPAHKEKLLCIINEVAHSHTSKRNYLYRPERLRISFYRRLCVVQSAVKSLWTPASQTAIQACGKSVFANHRAH